MFNCSVAAGLRPLVLDTLPGHHERGYVGRQFIENLPLGVKAIALACPNL
jgi:hypothetical protein